MRSFHVPGARLGALTLTSAMCAAAIAVAGAPPAFAATNAAGAKTHIRRDATRAHKKHHAKANKQPIKLGGFFTNSPIPVGGDALKMTEAVFNRVNAQGGIHGHKIQFSGGNDGDSATTTATLINNYVHNGTVALVGGVTLVACGIIGPRMVKANMISLMAGGAQQQCYTNPNIISVEPSPYTMMTAGLTYGFKQLHKTKQCMFQPLTPGSAPFFAAAVSAYEKATGNKLTIADTDIAASPSGSVSAATIDPLLVRAKAAGCQTFYYGAAIEPAEALILQQMKIEGMHNIVLMVPSIGYVQQLVPVAKATGIPVYAVTSLYPFTQPGKRTTAFRNLARKEKVNITDFSASAYIAANWMVSGLKAIKGPITRKSVMRYFKRGVPWRNSMAPVPLVFGPGKTHPIVISKLTMVKLANGRNWKLEKFGIPVPR